MKKSFQMIVNDDHGNVIAVENGFITSDKAMQYAAENYDAVMNWSYSAITGAKVAQARDRNMRFTYKIFVIEESHERPD